MTAAALPVAAFVVVGGAEEDETGRWKRDAADEERGTAGGAGLGSTLLPLTLLEEPVRRRYDDCFTRPGLIVVAAAVAALALEEGGDAEEPLPLLADPLRRPYEDFFTGPGAGAGAAELLAGSTPPARGSTPPARGGCAACLEAQDGAASAERGDFALDGNAPARAAVVLTLPVPERGEESAALLDGDTPGPLRGGDDGDGVLVAFAAEAAAALEGDSGDGDGDAAFGGESGKLREAGAAAGAAGAAGFAKSDEAGAFVFSARAAARKATRDGDGLAVADGGAKAAGAGAGGGEAALAEAPLDGGIVPAAALAEATVVAGRAGDKADALGSNRCSAGGAASGGGEAATAGETAGAGAAAAAGAARVPPDRAPASVSVISRACAVGLRLGASVERSASPGMRPPRSVAFASALADVSSHEISSAAPV